MVEQMLTKEIVTNQRDRDFYLLAPPDEISNCLFYELLVLVKYLTITFVPIYKHYVSCCTPMYLVIYLGNCNKTCLCWLKHMLVLSII